MTAAGPWSRTYCMLPFPDITFGHGSGSSLPLPVLALAGISTIVAVIVSGISIWLQLRNYRKPLLQRYLSHRVHSTRILSQPCRMVVRIMVMVPLYAVASFISLFSLEAAFFIDAIRDIYEVPPDSFIWYWLLTILVTGLCHILFLCTPPRLSWWRALATHPLARSTACPSCLSRQPMAQRDRPKRSVYISVSQTGHSA